MMKGGLITEANVKPTDTGNVPIDDLPCQRIVPSIITSVEGEK